MKGPAVIARDIAAPAQGAERQAILPRYDSLAFPKSCVKRFNLPTKLRSEEIEPIVTSFAGRVDRGYARGYIYLLKTTNALATCGFLQSESLL